MLFAVIFAAFALGTASVAVWFAWQARDVAIDARARFARHQSEHRLGLEEAGLRRHRAAETPTTAQIAAQRPPVPEPDGVDLEEHPPTGLIGPATPPPSGPYARLRENADRLDTTDLPATAAHPAPRRPGNAPNFAEAPPRPSLPPPGRIDRDR